MLAYFMSRMREKKIQRAAVTSNSSVFPQRRKTPKAEALQQKAASALATWAGSVGSLRYHWGKLSLLAAWEGHPGLGHLASYHVPMAGSYSMGKEGSGWGTSMVCWCPDVSRNSGALPSRYRERNICNFRADHQYPMSPTSIFSCSYFSTYTCTHKFKWSIKMPSSKTSTTSLHIRRNNASHKTLVLPQCTASTKQTKDAGWRQAACFCQSSLPQTTQA